MFIVDISFIHRYHKINEKKGFINIFTFQIVSYVQGKKLRSLHAYKYKCAKNATNN